MDIPETYCKRAGNVSHISMMTSMRLIVLTVLLFVGCVHAEANKMIVLDYSDFGPQAAAYELLGMQWWQWQSHGDSRPRKYDIKVVVYRDVPLDVVKQKYPVVKKEFKDFRYVSYDEAILYLDTMIQENFIPELTTKLEQTKRILVDY